MFGGYWTVKAFADQLAKLGIEAGDRIMAHTSLRAARISREDTPRLLKAYFEVLGPEGALYVPAHAYVQQGSGRLPYDLNTPCHRLIGAFPEWLRKQPGAIRSDHPTHSIVGIGAGVEDILAGHAQVDPAGYGSPMDKLRRLGAKVLLIGCGLESCTLLHLAEVMAEVPYLYLPPHGLEPVGLSRVGGRVHEVPIRISPLCSREFPRMEPILRASGALKVGSFGRAQVLHGSMEEVLAAATAAFRAKPFDYLCPTNCPKCADARAIARK